MPCYYFSRYLALAAALASEADYVLFPEWPPEVDWPSRMCKKLCSARIFLSSIAVLLKPFFSLFCSLFNCLIFFLIV
jgi:hypothetical protein